MPYLCALHPKRPHSGNVIFRRVRVVDDYDIRIIEKRICIEQAAVGSDRDGVGVQIGSPHLRIVVTSAPRETIESQPVGTGCLVDDLINKLAGRTKINNPIAVLSPQPFADHEADQSLTASCR